MLLLSIVGLTVTSHVSYAREETRVYGNKLTCISIVSI